jgi:hypothetical protein
MYFRYKFCVSRDQQNIELGLLIFGRDALSRHGKTWVCFVFIGVECGCDGGK